MGKMGKIGTMVVSMMLTGMAYGTNISDYTAVYDSDANTMALWHFDEAVTVSPSTKYYSADASGNSNATEISNDAAVVVRYDTVTKKFGESSLYSQYQRLGRSRWARAYDSTSLDITDELTVESWFYVTGVQNAGYNAVLMGKGTSVHEWSLAFPGGSDPTQRFLTATVSTTAATVDNRFVTSDISLDSVMNQWIHVAMTYNGNDVKVFMNGEQRGLQTYETTAQIYNGSSYINFLGLDHDMNFSVNGYVDEARVSNVVRYVPEPMTISMMVLGGLACLVRRRRSC